MNEFVYNQELSELACLDFPPKKEYPFGFMDICGIQHKEIIITRLYSYFLDKVKNETISKLFLESILDLVNQKTNFPKNIILDDYSCKLEFETKKGNRIDLLIYSNSKTISDTDFNIITAIIIENKIFSNVHNDLQDYYDDIDADVKIGILLTVNEQKIKSNLFGKFINITHEELINKIKEKGVPLGVNTNDYVYLNDFLNNMLKLKHEITMNDEVKFFFSNTSKILRAIEIHSAAQKFIFSQLQIASETLSLKLLGNSNIWRHLKPEDPNNHLYYAVTLDKIFNINPEIYIFLEINGKVISREKELRNILKENNFYNNSKLSDDGKSNQYWAHLAYKTYTLKQADLESFSNFIVKRIEDDFRDAYDILLNVLNK
jgi:hypothetical protein